MTTTDHDALLAACIKHPDEDTPRLMLADEIEDTDPARAELIRVQCELPQRKCTRDDADFANYRNGIYCGACQRRSEPIAELAARERALLRDNEARWRKGPTCGKCGGDGSGPPGSRGYIAKDCPACFGTGDVGGLLRKFDYGHHALPFVDGPVRVHIEWDRGFIERVDVPTMDVLVSPVHENDHYERLTYGTHRPTPWLRSVLTATPERLLIESVVPLDREPIDLDGEFWWWPTPGEVNRLDSHGYSIPDGVFRLMTGGRRGYREGHRTEHSWVYPTREAAISALGRAVVTWARKELATCR